MEIPAPDFDLALTLDSGQVFHWESFADGFVGTISERALYVEQRGQLLRVRDSRKLSESPAREAPALASIAAQYFSLDHPLREICASLPNDPVMQEAAAFCRGLRIIRQPKWECLATFITSSMKQVAHIRQISQSLRRRFGNAKSLGEVTIYAYPNAETIAALDERMLRQCALGYRAKNLLRTAQLVAERTVDLEALSNLPDDELRARLCDLPGVGTKVANCVMLFAYERLRAFPIDVWVERVLREKYFTRRRKLTAGELREFAARHFGAHGGYAQQYLFHYARKTTPRRPARRLSPRVR